MYLMHIHIISVQYIISTHFSLDPLRFGWVCLTEYSVFLTVLWLLCGAALSDASGRSLQDLSQVVFEDGSVELLSLTAQDGAGCLRAVKTHELLTAHWGTDKQRVKSHLTRLAWEDPAVSLVLLYPCMFLRRRDDRFLPKHAKRPSAHPLRILKCSWRPAASRTPLKLSAFHPPGLISKHIKETLKSEHASARHFEPWCSFRKHRFKSSLSYLCSIILITMPKMKN